MRWILIVSAAFAAAITGCSGGSAEKPVESSPVSSAAPTPQPADSRPVIAAFGDSLSAGLGLEAGRSYPDVLQRLIDQAGYRYHVVNMGVSGDTTTDGVERLPSVLALHPAVVIVEFGANDGLRGQPVASTKANLAVMIETLQKAGANVVLAGMTLPRNYGPEYIHSFEGLYVDLANRYQLARIPFFLDGVGGHADLTQPDGLHPTARGTEIVAHTVMKYLERVLEKPPRQTGRLRNLLLKNPLMT